MSSVQHILRTVVLISTVWLAPSLYAQQQPPQLFSGMEGYTLSLIHISEPTRPY